ncbi:hypothetical protein BCR44DRAFT_35434 [Catenaria anguillulae PL171]|uniref:Uncharacterized protein n=1 Tax=Catenaria anguillulae PL171 TaxID=765915 RepID=A0A1Y2HRN5_9FUNG|nr:hypothetical protein BCR44DRAFT_35434 [Catenaria anguillulae PL171]
MAGGSIPGLSFELSILVSGLFASLICTLITVGIERFGGIIGGVLGSVPHTIVPASMGFYFQYRTLGASSSSATDLTQAGLEEFQRSMIACIPGMFINCAYLLMWRHLPVMLRSRLPNISVTSLLLLVLLCCALVWLAMASALVVGLGAFLHPRPMAELANKPVESASLQVVSPRMHPTVIFGFVILSLQMLVGLFTSWTPPPAPKSRVRVPIGILAARGICAGLAVAASILIGLLSSFAAGVASTAPVIFTTSIIATWVSSGEAVSSGAIGTLLLGSASISMYAMLSALLIVPLGGNYWLMAVVAWVLSVVGVSAPSFAYVTWRRGVTQRREDRGLGNQERESQDEVVKL